MSNSFQQDGTFQQQAIKLMKPLIPRDAEDRVQRAVKQLNQSVRECIRQETGLRLSDEKGKGAAPIHIADGFPDAVAELINKYRDQLLWRLIMAQPKLGGVVEGLNILIDAWDDFEQWPELPDIARGSKQALQHTVEVVDSLQKLIIARDVLKEIKKINEDILGVYRFGGAYSPRIEIYWMAHALFAAAFGLKIEDLVAVTLAHELTHAYTHMGKDIDGESWHTHGFGQSHSAVIEGLAQFYTEAVTEKLSTRMPGAFDAYRTILNHQSGPYLVHKSWFNENVKRKGEIVRFALVRSRREGKVDENLWMKILAETFHNLGEK